MHTFCRICEARCGLAVTVDRNRVTRIAPDKDNPYSWKDFCAKGRTAAQMIEHPRRLREPMRRVGDRFVPVTWDEAVGGIATALRSIVDRFGVDAVATYSGNPIGFNGANALYFAEFKNVIGSRNNFTVASIDHNNLKVVCWEMYGDWAISLIPDIDETRCLLLIGMNPADSTFSWIYNTPDGWRRALDAQARGADLIVVDPVRTRSAEAADLHVAVWPGQDWAFLLGVLKVILDEGWDHSREMVPSTGVDRLRELVGRVELVELAERCRVPVEMITDVAQRFAAAPAAFCVAHTGVSHQLTGTLAEWLTHVLNAVTARLDARGGRFVQRGYLAPRPKAGPGADTVARSRSRVGGIESVQGALPLAELANEIVTPGAGQVRALIVNSGNPVVAGPQGGELEAALSLLDLHVVCDLVQRQSHHSADWLLPGTHWLERDDLLYFYSTFEERPFVQYGRAAVAPPPGVREEWELWRDLGAAMGLPLFGVERAHAVGLVDGEAVDGDVVDPSRLLRSMVEGGGCVDWLDLLSAEHGLFYTPPDSAGLRDLIGHDDGLIRLAPPRFIDEIERQLGLDARAPTGTYILTNRRDRDSMNSWLNDLPGLHRSGRSNPLYMHPDDARDLGVDDEGRVRVTSSSATLEMSVRVSTHVQPGVVVAAHGWGSAAVDPSGAEATVAHGVNRNLLTSSREVDPLSGIPAFNQTIVRLVRCDKPMPPARRGPAISTE